MSRPSDGPRATRWRTPVAVLVKGLVAVLVAVAAGPACTGDDAAPADTAGLPGVPGQTVAESPADDTPFCRTMLSLGTAGLDPTVDDEDGPTITEVIAAYREIADEVPAAVAASFDVVLDRLVTVEAGGEVADVARADEASLTLSAFVDMRCRATAVNPLPPATQPSSEE